MLTMVMPSITPEVQRWRLRCNQGALTDSGASNAGSLVHALLDRRVHETRDAAGTVLGSKIGS